MTYIVYLICTMLQGIDSLLPSDGWSHIRSNLVSFLWLWLGSDFVEF